MNEPIRRSQYPETRDEQAMRRFMEGTLNVGHNLTFQRKSMIVNVSPPTRQREQLAQFFDSLSIHKNERCYNARLIIHPQPLAENLRLSREMEYNKFPYSHAEITLTPAQSMSDQGKRRNMHMQTHNPLMGAPTVNVFGVGRRKGEIAMLQFVKDCVTYRTDLERDEADAAIRENRPFILPFPADPLASLPADPSTHIRHLFETESECAPTPDDVAARAQQVASLFLDPSAAHGAHLSVFQHSPNIVPASTLISNVSTHGSQDGHFRPSVLTSNYQPHIATHGAFDQIPSEDSAERIPNNVQHLCNSLESAVRAAKIIFPRNPTVRGGKVPHPISTLPDTKYFLDWERCRETLRRATISPDQIFAAWQANRTRAQTSYWSTTDNMMQQNRQGTEAMADQESRTVREASPSASTSIVAPDDSGVCFTTNDEQTDLVNGKRSRSRTGDGADQSSDPLPWDQFAFQMVSPERPIHPSSFSTPTAPASEEAQTPRMRAASTLLSLSPAKPQLS